MHNITIKKYRRVAAIEMQVPVRPGKGGVVSTAREKKTPPPSAFILHRGPIDHWIEVFNLRGRHFPVH